MTFKEKKASYVVSLDATYIAKTSKYYFPFLFKLRVQNNQLKAQELTKIKS